MRSPFQAFTNASRRAERAPSRTYVHQTHAFFPSATMVPTPVGVKNAGMPAPAARMRSENVPCGTRSSWIFPDSTIGLQEVCSHPRSANVPPNLDPPPGQTYAEAVHSSVVAHGRKVLRSPSAPSARIRFFPESRTARSSQHNGRAVRRRRESLIRADHNLLFIPSAF